MPHYARKVDRNQAEIMEALERAGYRVLSTHRFGHGWPDLHAISKADIPVWIEVKGVGEKLTEPEERWWDWYGEGPGGIAYSADDALELMYPWD